MPDQLTVLTDAHKKVIDRLERWGLGVMEEVEFPPYRVDIYLPAFHAAVEVDGPQHEERRDRRRNRELSRAYSLHTFHVAAAEVRSPDKWKLALQDFLRYAGKTKEQRWEQCKMRTPWL